MLREHDKILRAVMVALDIALITAAFYVSHLLRNHFYDVLAGLNIPNFYKTYPLSDYVSMLPVMLLAWIVTLHAVGSYQHTRGKPMTEIQREILAAGAISLLAFTSLAFLLKLDYVSRSLIVMNFGLSWIFLSLERIQLLRTLRSLRKEGHNLRFLLVVGTGKRARVFLERVAQHPEWGLKIQGLIDKEAGLIGQEILGHRVIGTLDGLPEILEHTVVDEVVFVVPRSWLEEIEPTILYCEQLGKKVNVAMDLYTPQIAKVRFDGLHDQPFITYQTTPDKIGQLIFKRLLDILLSAFLLVILSPFFLAIALLIKVSSKGPVFFKQIRASRSGRIFAMYKFRTMVVDAEARLEALRHHNEMSGPAFKMANDPRLIRFGKWLRKFSLDELPQLYNVLMGDMSIVGPRPPIPAEVKRYQPWQRRRLSMRPGLTCIWQVEGRNRIVDFDEWMRLDLQYIDTWSLALDFKICLKTIPVVLFGVGAK
ncbi:MAG: hypothetical protein A2Y02_01500 [Omnitrophica bacterium GWA2_52_12]|nr:MAG: hypothetical protein A2Y02_01500 [Omnitrophica bacterium GWA2_52_12]